MFQEISFSTPSKAVSQKQLASFCTPAELSVLDPNAVTRHQADIHLMLLDSTGAVVARCSLWWRHTPPYPDQKLGLIGHYGARDSDAAAQLLSTACNQLIERDCTMAVGPMDGNTWQSYRLLIDRGAEPAFFLEPDNPDDWPLHFTANGFSTLARYFSTLNSDLSRQNPRLASVATRAAKQGIKIRPLRLDSFDDELRQIYAIVLASFSRNFLYTPISRDDFLTMYHPLRPYIQAELILIAERNGQPIGFIFALPDLLQAKRGQPIDTSIIKTVAVHPEHQIAGLGTLLVARCQEVAHSLGYKRAIHALMHENNASRKISHRSQTEPIRRYALFARRLY